MKIAAMYETEISRGDDGSIEIRQMSPNGEEDHVVRFPLEMAQTITAEILRLAAEAAPKS